MFSSYDENKLNKLLENFANVYLAKNNLEIIPKYEQILQWMSCFAVYPDWNETKFLSKKQAMECIPLYVAQRKDYFSQDDHVSSTLISNKKLEKYYLVSKKACPKIVNFCNKLIKVILITELSSYIEGTSSDGLGIAHIDFKKNYNQIDFNELIIHQITHMLLFIDDYVDYQIIDTNKKLPIVTELTHKRGGNTFPLYVLFHSFCVGIEILYHRVNSSTPYAQINYHPITLTAQKRCGDISTILNKNINLFTENGRGILRYYTDLLNDLIFRSANAV